MTTSREMGKTIIVLYPLILFTLAACQSREYQFHGSPYVSPQPAPEFVIASTQGSEFRLSEEKGRPVLLFFGYTYCPDVCPTTLADVRWVFNELGERSDEVSLVMITVDPERDSLIQLKQYLTIFNPGFIGARAEGEELETLKSAYGVYAGREPSENPDDYLVTHTARVFVIDKDGFLITNYSFGTPKEEILQDLEYLLQSS
jgi:protein SCO1/2